MILFYLREAWRSMNKHRGIVLASILSLSAALTLWGLFLLLAHNVQWALELLGDRREMVVYLKDDVSPSVRDSLVGRLHNLYGSVTYVSKGQAWEELKQQIGDESLLDAVGQNPLPASLRVRLKPELLHYSTMREAANQVSQFPEVEDVRFGDEWVRRLDQLGSSFQKGAVAVGIVVGLAIVLMVYNTIRLTVVARRSQVEIMSRLGGSDGFIAAPFIVEAIFVAMVAALLALGMLFLLQQAVIARVVTIVFLSPSWMAAFVGVAVLLAWVAASLAMTRVLRQIGP
jgi:cell division transport system permease protein